MATFDVSFLNPKFRKSNSQDYGFLVDQLQIKENQLSADGKLSPGDYDALKKDAMKIYAHPGLTPAQRSNLEVKMSGYDTAQKKSQLSDTRDIARTNREMQDDNAKITMLYANNPKVLLQAKADSTRLKIDRLSQAIDSLQNSGDDASAQINEYNSTLSDYSDLVDALKSVDDYSKAPSGKPVSNYVAYITTNSRGEINGVDIARTGSKSGYVETNGLYGGLQIYGKVNRKEFGKNIFQLGNNTFSAADFSLPDPSNPGAMKYNPLISDDQKVNRGGFQQGTIGQYKDVDTSTVRPQAAIYDGGWAEGQNGFLYERLPGGKYRKYVNADKQKLGVSDNNILRVPASLEQSFTPDVTETIDGAQPFTPPVPATTTPALPPTTAQAPTPTFPTTPQPLTLGQGRGRSGAPVERAPQTATGQAQSAIGKAKNFLSNLFSGKY